MKRRKCAHGAGAGWQRIVQVLKFHHLCCFRAVIKHTHWGAWLRGAIERHCQFSREARLHRAKKKEGSYTPSLGYYTQPTGKSHTQVDACVCGGESHPSPFPDGCQQSAARPASCWRSVCSKLGNR